MARTYEEMVNINLGSSATKYGFIAGTTGLLSPEDIDGNSIAEISGDATNDTVTIALTDALPAGVTEMTAVFYHPEVGGSVVTLTTLDQIVWTAVSADVVLLLLLAEQSIPVHIAYTDAGADAQLGEDNEPQCVRVGEEPADPIAIPRNLLGVDGADYTNGVATDYPDAGNTNEVGGGCR